MQQELDYKVSEIIIIHLCAHSGKCLLNIGTENLAITQGSFERIKESAGLELDIFSLHIHKSAFWHHIINKINEKT